MSGFQKSTQRFNGNLRSDLRKKLKVLITMDLEEIYMGVKEPVIKAWDT